MKNMFKGIGIIAISVIFAFSMTACSDGGGDTGDKSNWWVWHSSDSIPTAKASISPSSDDTACDITVTGTANEDFFSWATQVGVNYKATAGKTYIASFKWQANNKAFEKVGVRYAQSKDYLTDYVYSNDEPEYFAYYDEDGNECYDVIYERYHEIPTTEEEVLFEFIMPANSNKHITFMVGEDIGSFRVWDFKVEEKN